MKQFILLLTIVASTLATGQSNVDLATFAGTTVSGDRLDNRASYFYYSDTDVSSTANLTKVSTSDTIMLFYTVGEINDPSIQGSSIGDDTLELDLAFVTWTGTSNASYTISYNLGSFSYTDVSSSTLRS